MLVVFGLEMVQQILEQTNLKVQQEDFLHLRNLSQIWPCAPYSLSSQGLLNKPHQPS